jgi:hypothetical protein
MSLKIRTFVGLAMAMAMAMLGCSSPPEASVDGEGADKGAAGASRSEESVGSVRMRLTLSSGQGIAVVSWAISGPAGAATVVQSGTVDNPGLSASFLVGGIPAGSGYEVTLSGTATDGSVICAGSTQFNVAAQVTTQVSVGLGCSVASSGSQVTLVNGTSFNCAATNGIAANPSETTVGHSVALTGGAAGPAPSALTYQWSAATGSFSQPNGAMTNFTCASVGPVTVTLTVGDGPVPPGQSCSASIDTATAVITCDESQTSPDGGSGGSGGSGGAGGSGGSGPPPPATPAMPPWGVAFFAAALCAVGSLISRRRNEVRS